MTGGDSEEGGWWIDHTVYHQTNYSEVHGHNMTLERHLSPHCPDLVSHRHMAHKWVTFRLYYAGYLETFPYSGSISFLAQSLIVRSWLPDTIHLPSLEISTELTGAV